MLSDLNANESQSYLCFKGTGCHFLLGEQIETDLCMQIRTGAVTESSQPDNWAITPVWIEERTPKHQSVLHCATSPIFVCAREHFLTLLAHSVLWLTKQHLISMGMITNTVKGWKTLCWCQTLMASNFGVVARNLIISVISKEFKVVVKKKVPHHPGKWRHFWPSVRHSLELVTHLCDYNDKWLFCPSLFL